MYEEDRDFTPELQCKFNKVLVIGLGQLGLPVAKSQLRRRDLTLTATISTKKLWELASRTYGVKSFKDFSDIDVFIICVSTHNPHDMSSPEVEGLLSLAENISVHAKAEYLSINREHYPKRYLKKDV